MIGMPTSETTVTVLLSGTKRLNERMEKKEVEEHSIGLDPKVTRVFFLFEKGGKGGGEVGSDFFLREGLGEWGES